MTADQDPRAQQALLDMQQAFDRQNLKQIKALLPLVQKHPLSYWGHYWDLSLRLNQATKEEIVAFLNDHKGMYVEDRLRAQWLIVLGKAADWLEFETQHKLYRMGDDPQIACLKVASALRQSMHRVGDEQVQQILSQWQNLRGPDDVCTPVIASLHQAKRIAALDIWQKVRSSVEYSRAQTAQGALEIVAPQKAAQFRRIYKDPLDFAKRNPRAAGEWLTLALVRSAQFSPDKTAEWLRQNSHRLNPEQRDWAWAAIGRQAAWDLNDRASAYFSEVQQPTHLNDELLEWSVRSALRQANGPLWPMVLSGIQAMSPATQRDPAWRYWLGRALQVLHPHDSDPAQIQARVLLEELSGIDGFYPQLALHALGKAVVIPRRPPPPSPADLAKVKDNRSLQRGLLAIQLGLRREGVREWNYGTSLVDEHGQPGRLSPTLMHAAAHMAYDAQVWDRAITTSERSGLMDVELRFPRPFLVDVVERSRDIGLNPAEVYGLIRQESRFIMDARSSVGASGLMQVMPATAHWTAKHLGMQGFRTEHLKRHDVNIAIGTGYMKLVLEDFQGQLALAAAAYNAGPKRARKWRQGPTLDAEIWAENIPFTETRGYVKNVLANATVYAALIAQSPQHLSARLGSIGPAKLGSSSNRDLP